MHINQSEDFRTIGKMVATSILQGGPGFPVLLPAAYNYIVTGKYVGQISNDSEVPDPLIRQLLNQIDMAESDDQLRSLFTDPENESLILETGFRKPLPLLIDDDKSTIKAALRDHHTLVKIKPEMDQFMDGLATVGVMEKVKSYPELMAPLLTVIKKKEVNKAYFKSLFDVSFSTNDDDRKNKEQAAFINFLDFIEDCEDGLAKTEDGRVVHPEDILIFFSGADHEPPFGFIPKPNLTFTGGKLAYSSTCALRLTLPIDNNTYNSFKYYMVLSLVGNDGFGRV